MGAVEGGGSHKEGGGETEGDERDGAEKGGVTEEEEFSHWIGELVKTTDGEEMVAIVVG